MAKTAEFNDVKGGSNGVAMGERKHQIPDGQKLVGGFYVTHDPAQFRHTLPRARLFLGKKIM